MNKETKTLANVSLSSLPSFCHFNFLVHKDWQINAQKMPAARAARRHIAVSAITKPCCRRWSLLPKSKTVHIFLCWAQMTIVLCHVLFIKVHWKGKTLFLILFVCFVFFFL